MTRELALDLLNRVHTGGDLLSIVDMIASDLEAQRIEECAAHYAAITVNDGSSAF
jgi:hypothetical protein